MRVAGIGAYSHTVGFISCRSRLTKMLAGAARGETGCKGGGGQVRLSDVDTRELAGFQNEFICHFILTYVLLIVFCVHYKSRVCFVD